MDNLLKDFEKKVKKEFLIKSLIFSGIISFSIMGILALISLFKKENFLLVILVVGLLVFAISAIIFNKLIFKTTNVKIAQKVDSLGLDERLITMLEFENSDNPMMKIQREDAQEVVKKVEASKLNIKWSLLKLPIILCIAIFFATCNLTIGSVVVATIEGNKEPDVEVEEEIVDIHKETIAEMVDDIRDIIDEAYWLDQWILDYLHAIVDDMEKDLENYEILDYNTKFQRINETEELILYLIWFYSDPTDEEEFPDGGNSKDEDYVIDGETPYEDVFPESYEEAMDLINNGNISDEFKKIIQEYFGIIDPNVEEGE